METRMHPIKQGLRSMSVLLRLNSDLLLHGATLGAALLVTAFLLTL